MLIRHTKGMPGYQDELKTAAEYLSHVDKILEPIIARAGLAIFEPHTDYYWALVDSIISQQLSVKAAATIEKRFRELFKEAVPQPSSILKQSRESLRSVGLSNAKASYIYDLAGHVVDGKLDFVDFTSMTNEAIIAELTDVKGIGEWTAHMFLMFCMGRLNVLAVGDLGIRNGIQRLYKLDHVPTQKEVSQLAVTKRWSPYESVACWYVWKSVDTIPLL